MAQSFYIRFAVVYAIALIAAAFLIWALETYAGASPRLGIAPACFVAGILFAGMSYSQNITERPSSLTLWGASVILSILAILISAAPFALIYFSEPELGRQVLAELGKIEQEIWLIAAAVIVLFYILTARLFLQFAVRPVEQS